MTKAKARIFQLTKVNQSLGQKMREIDAQVEAKANKDISYLGLDEKEAKNYRQELQDQAALLKAGLQEQIDTNEQMLFDLNQEIGGTWMPGQRTTAAPAPSNTQPSPSEIQAGTVMDGYRFKGGDPSDQDNWEKVE